MKREQLKKLYELTNEVTMRTEEASEAKRVAEDRFGTNLQKVFRKGKEVEITEKTLWEEVFYLGTGSEAGKILKTLHPEVFEAYQKQARVADELKIFVQQNFGFDYTRMTIADYLKMTEGMYNLLQKERMLVKVDKLFAKIKIFFKKIFK